MPVTNWNGLYQQVFSKGNEIKIVHNFHGPRFSTACRISRRATEFAFCCGIHHVAKYAETVILADMLIYWLNFYWLILLFSH